MTRNTNRLMTIAAATLTLGVSAAYGQGQLTADVPFEFKAGGTTMSAGSYSVARIGTMGGAQLLRVREEKTHRAIGVSSAYRVNGKSADVSPRLVFACGPSGCELAQLWTGESTGMAFMRHKNAADTERMASVKLTPNTAAGE